ncbi:MAG: DnaJ domain-containing protein [Deltaproteobacteria bacterium]|nr:DnaJ domain-containing protein [Deltaproteobacteria bacterium]
MLRDLHADIRQTDDGEYFYGRVSAISLALLLAARLPPKEMLWAWYQHFDQERSESVYRTLSPVEDEILLVLLGRCAFRWDEQAIRASGLVFEESMRQAVYHALEDSLCTRMEEVRALKDQALRAYLDPGENATETQLRKRVRELRQTPLEPERRQKLYASLESPYQRATARQMLEEATGDGFWKNPPSDLEVVAARLSAFSRALLETSIRLGVYRDPESPRHGKPQDRSQERKRGAPRKSRGGSVETRSRHLAVLGLGPWATVGEVKNAYREKAKEHHPDQGGAIQEFLRIQAAYEFLMQEVPQQ